MLRIPTTGFGVLALYAQSSITSKKRKRVKTNTRDRQIRKHGSTVKMIRTSDNKTDTQATVTLL